MALSTCIKCGGRHFEEAPHEPIGSRVKIWLLQCATCGGVIGVSDHRVLGDLRDVERKVDKVQSSVNRLD